jgi:hypothetical protein
MIVSSASKARAASAARPAATLVAQVEAFNLQAVSATTVAFAQSVFSEATFLSQEIFVALHATAAARVSAVHLHVFEVE